MRSARLQPFMCVQLRPLRLSLRPSWICPSHRPNGALSRRWNSSAQTKEKPFYVTTPIFYVNAAPHIGHLYCTVLADVLKRWQQINGKEAYFCTGTDEHGMKIQRAAAKEGMDPKSFCDLNSDKFRSLTHDADISNDFFVRTTDPDHKDAVSQFWLQLKNSLPKELGLYKGTHEGWYCVSDECFYPEDLVQPSIVPQTGKKIMINVESENEVEWVKEETWFFPLTKYKDALLKFYDENPGWVKPANRMQEVRDWVENHLEDLSVTRPVSRLNWGIADPEDPTQTIYVWVDALINYITKAGYGSQWRTPTDDMGIWPADLHIIGKDILRFHAIYWPALLLALGLPPAKGILCHNHWTMSNRKMSKSLGNVVNPVFALQRWDVDPLRYFLMRNGNLTKDMSYSNDIISAIYGKELQANIGNLFYRIAKPKGAAGWSTRRAVASSNSGAFKELDEVRHKAEYSQFFSLESTLGRASDAFSKEMEDYNTGGAIREAFELLRDTNRYITDTQPWVLAKQKGALSQLLLNWTIHRSAEALRIAAILLQPIMPSKMKRLLDEMGVRPDRRAVAYAHPDADDAYGTRNQGNSNHDRANKHLTLFPPMASGDVSDAEVLQQLKAYLGKNNIAKSKMNQMVELLAMEARMGEAQVAKLLDTDLPVEHTPPRNSN
ncbi:Methionyl-tRNA synthetase [Beauveria brongniartii RCEF 3172]|uniref:Methionine--tRNA ligase, mitochondrial n=1 Tax=Beauveria brongniartii RCEF 3172 TaxID=1081107 RepID=A0A167A0D2_9HYPO|nr:Methionyl-tRNA synthetase [Beauveria brongniartii RCEF 3172]